METSSNRVQVDFKFIVCPRYRFVCIAPQFSNEHLCFIVPGSKNLGRRCLFFLLEGIQTLYFPSFQFVRQKTNKLKVEEVPDALVIAPWCPTAHWYPPLLQLLVQRPILLPQWDELLTLPQEDFLHPLKGVMRLAAWHVSGITYRSEEFLQGQPAMCSSHGVQGQKISAQRLGNVFVAGVIGNREILFKQI